MSMLTDLKKEHKKITHEISAGQRKLKALEAMMKEYGIRLHCSDKTLGDLAIECLQSNDGHASYDTIVECLHSHGVDADKPKISQILAHHPAMDFDRKKAEWTLVNHQVVERLDRVS